jgi:hypothetical protein
VVRALGLEVARFRVIGSSSQQVLSKALLPEAGCRTAGIWSSLAALESPSCLPPSVVLSCSMYDPRTVSLRAGLAAGTPADPSDLGVAVDISTLCTRWPHAAAHSVDGLLWDDKLLASLSANLYVSCCL